MAQKTRELFVEDDELGADTTDDAGVEDVDDASDEGVEDESQEGSDDTEDSEDSEGTEDADDGEEDSGWDEERARAEIRKKNNEARNLRKRNKDLLAEVTALRKEKADNARKRIAAEHGLPESFAARLAGETEEDWEADAEELSASLKSTKRKPAPTKNPGASGAGQAPKLSKADLFFGA